MGTKQKRFTLIELLVVVAVISVLAGIAVPAIASTRHAARRISCLGRLRQLGFAFHSYSLDYRGLIPHEDGGSTLPPHDCCWFDLIDPYVDFNREVKHCTIKDPELRYKSFKMNSVLDNGGRAPFYKIGTAENETRLILLFDGRIDNHAVKYQPKGSSGSVSSRHKSGKEGGANFLFADGHAAWHSEIANGGFYTIKDELEWEPE